jgi:hypothetical protein
MSNSNDYPQSFQVATGVVKRCNARTRRGTSCQRHGFGNGDRCRLHGGASSGPKTQAGRERIAEYQKARWMRWRADHPRRLPEVTRRHEARVRKASHDWLARVRLLQPEQISPPAPQYVDRLQRDASRHAENERGARLMASRERPSQYQRRRL